MSLKSTSKGESPAEEGTHKGFSRVDQPTTLTERREEERRVWRMGLLISLGLHILVFLLWPTARIPVTLDGAAGPRAGDDRAAEGVMQAIALQSAPPDAARPPPTVPTLEVDLPEPVDIEPEALPEVDLSAPEPPEPGQGRTTGTDSADADAAGLPGATGAGDAGGAEAGRSGPPGPTPIGMIMPRTDAPRSVRGTETVVWVFVSESGRVVADSTRLEPPTPDRDFNASLVREASQWAFRPARPAGEPVASWFSFRLGW